MSDEEKAEMMREFVKALEIFDQEKAYSFCADDLVWVMPMKTYKGKEELREFFKWLSDTVKDYKITETGNGILVQGDKAFFEHTMSGIMQGEKVSYLALCAYEFKDGKIKELRTVFDRLSIAEQASSKWLPKKFVNTIVSQMQKGLD
ncbi:MAG: nuclear transport factor 2 family protein [Bacillota bacterium]|nr:nuclear transport factor 2 family protein [Bacillota bacterium]